ncbi:development/cell death domain-containing protein [Artemisia annua]|uniref:Development/cell death domain-containing protein n=1 Tax=Artemisia annua TaxID=35608 RepID=A0A2U1MER4_ARTAN|nr:development/cell death domain-containing protein [Artemisia annua]
MRQLVVIFLFVTMILCKRILKESFLIVGLKNKRLLGCVKLGTLVSDMPNFVYVKLEVLEVLYGLFLCELLVGLPPRYRDSVRQITPGLPLFLYNYSTHQLHGVFEAASFGGTNIDPSAWEDKKNPGESRFPAQVRVMTRKVAEPLEEDSFRPILHHYDGPKFRLELNIPEALSLLDIFEESKN